MESTPDTLPVLATGTPGSGSPGQSDQDIARPEASRVQMAGAEGADSKEQIGNPVDAVAENGHAATGIVANDAGPQEQQQQEQEQPVVLSEFERELKKAKENPSDFNQWVAVEKLLEKEGSIEKTREVYDGFLAEYPLCYAYWRKYAEWEHKSSSPEWAVSVYERGVAAVPYSCDLWGHYAGCKQRLSAPAEQVREVFEQGAAYVGTDYLSHILWDKYIKYELQHGTPAHVTRLYLQILGSPLRDLNRYYTSFKDFVHTRGTTELIGEEEANRTRDLLQQAKLAESGEHPIKEELEAASEAAKAVKTEASAEQPVENPVKAPAANGSQAEAMEIDSIPAGDPTQAEVKQEVNGHAEDAKLNIKEADMGDEGKESADGLSMDVSGNDKEEASITDEDVKAYWLSGITALYQESKAELSRRKVFEDVIKRPYFHVKPLPAVQLEAWDAYIDYILTKDDAGTVVRLFERCLVACASYPDFWARYIRYLARGDPENAKIAIQRAQQVHCKRDAYLHLLAAKYHERAGDVEAARSTYKLLLEKLAPDLVEAIVQAANFERRQSNMEAACKAFDDALEREEQKEDSAKVGAMLAMFYGTFLYLDCEEPVKARSLYQRVLKKWSNLTFLWEAALHFEEHCLEKGQTGRVVQLYRDALSCAGEKGEPALSMEDRQTLSQRLIDFADRRCSPEEAALIEEKHASEFSTYKLEAASRKRSAESSLQEPAAKKAAVDTSQLNAAVNAVSPQAANPYQPAQNPTDSATAQPIPTPAASGAAAIPAYPAYHDPSGYASQPMASGAPVPNYYPQASAGYNAYGYGYQYPQQYGYSYAGYQ